MRAFAISVGLLISGVLKRFLVWLPFLLLDLADVYDRYVLPHLPAHWLPRLQAWPDPIPLLLLVALALAIALTYHEMRLSYAAVAGTEPRLSHWRAVKRFAVWEAAYLFTEREPIPPPISVQSDRHAFRYWKELQALHKAGAFRDAHMDAEEGKVFVSRADLIRYAESAGERPRFLYEDS